MSQTLTIAAGGTLAEDFALSGPDATGAVVPAVFDVSSVIEANVSQGPNSPVIFHPSVSWKDSTGSVIAFKIAPTQTADLPPRNYVLEVWVRPAGTTDRISVFDGYLSVLPSADVSPGTAPSPIPGVISQGNAPARLGAVYCTDEDIAVEVPFDYVAICPKDQITAQAWDGAFLVGDPWTLTSVTIDFAASGVGPNDVVYLTKPTQVFGTNGIGTLMAVDTVSGHSVTLRRVNGRLYEGAPPVSGALTGVEFKVLTFLPQIEWACYDLRKEFGIDDAIPDEANALLYDPIELRRVTVLTVVADAYADKGDKSDYAHKYAVKQGQLGKAMGRLQLHWGALGMGKAPTGATGGHYRR